MTTSAMNIAIENRFMTAWGSTTTVKIDNVPFTIPATSWVSIEVWDGLSDRASLGGAPALRRSTGTVYVNVYTPVGNGSKPARDLCDTVSTIFRDVLVSGITFREPTVKRIGEQTVAGGTTQWFQMVVAIPFFYDVII